MELQTIKDIVTPRLRPPVAFVLGGPGEVARLLAELDIGGVTCYQMDLFQAARLKDEARQRGLDVKVAPAADLWDLGTDFQTVLYLAQKGGERQLKIDMVEQAFHLLAPHGRLLVVSPYERDEFFPRLLKKIFGKVKATRTDETIVFWCNREKDRPRRRHEVTFQVRANPETSVRFLSRPGVFTYGRFDDGARALVETAEIHPGDRILDLGCGCGTNGVIASLRAGPTGEVVFLDSNLRALALAEINARANGLTKFDIVASSQVTGPTEASFDVVLCNPPYYAGGAIAELFIERSRVLLRPGGRFYLVTKQADEIGLEIAKRFGTVEVQERRGYAVLCALAE